MKEMLIALLCSGIPQAQTKAVGKTQIVLPAARHYTLAPPQGLKIV
jgi:hypothetical protein